MTALATLFLYHDEIYNIVEDEDPDNTQSTAEEVVFDGVTYPLLGEYRVSSIRGEGEDIRKKIQQTRPGSYTEVTVSPDFNPANPKEFTHLAEMLLERHAPGEHITGLFSPDNVPLAKRIAAVMGIEYLKTAPVAQEA